MMNGMNKQPKAPAGSQFSQNDYKKPFVLSPSAMLRRALSKDEFAKIIGIYTSTYPFSLEGEGWDEGDISGYFYSPLPNPLQQEREQSQFATHCIYNIKKLCRYLCEGRGGQKLQSVPVPSITRLRS